MSLDAEGNLTTGGDFLASDGTMQKWDKLSAADMDKYKKILDKEVKAADKLDAERVAREKELMEQLRRLMRESAR